VAALATIAVLVFLLGFAGVTWQSQRASKARDLAQGRLYESLVREARATRTARRVGYRDEVFTLLQQARALDVPQKNITELRREAVACLGDFVGLTPLTLTDFPSNTTLGVVHMDPTWSFAAFSLSDGTLLLRQMPSGTESAGCLWPIRPGAIASMRLGTRSHRSMRRIPGRQHAENSFSGP